MNYRIYILVLIICIVRKNILWTALSVKQWASMIKSNVLFFFLSNLHHFVFTNRKLLWKLDKIGRNCLDKISINTSIVLSGSLIKLFSFNFLLFELCLIRIILNICHYSRSNQIKRLCVIFRSFKHSKSDGNVIAALLWTVRLNILMWTAKC